MEKKLKSGLTKYRSFSYSMRTRNICISCHVYNLLKSIRIIHFGKGKYPIWSMHKVFNYVSVDSLKMAMSVLRSRKTC